MVLCISKLDKLFECVNTITMLVVKLSANGHRMGSSAAPGRGASEKRSAVGFCLGSGLFGSYNSD